MAKATTTLETAPAPTVTTLPIPQDMPRQIISDGKVWQALRVNGFFGYVPSNSPLPTDTPFMSWEGGRISLEVWQQVLAFFKWSQGEFKAETQVRMFYNKVSRRWAPWAFPQRPNGMTTNELPDHADYEPQRRQFPEPWMLLGTVHHHCTSAAFQSGTDTHNETSQEGIHITVGNLDKEEWSIHSRVYVRGQKFDVALRQWFELPDSAVNLPLKIQNTVLEFFLKQPPNDEVAFPAQWKANCIRWAVHTITTPTAVERHSRNGMHQNGTVGGGRNIVMIRSDLRAQFKPPEVFMMREMIEMMEKHHIIHTRLDHIMFGVTDPKQLTDIDRNVISETYRLAARHGVEKPRLDQLIDCWDFATVIEELDRPPETGAAAFKAAVGATTAPLPPLTDEEAQAALNEAMTAPQPS